MTDADKNKDNQLIVPHEILPAVIPVIPLSQRPVFPGMMIPLVLTGDIMIDTASEILESDNKIGGVVLIENQHDGPTDSSDLYRVGVGAMR